jgi:hypothetical protein
MIRILKGKIDFGAVTPLRKPRGVGLGGQFPFDGIAFEADVVRSIDGAVFEENCERKCDGNVGVREVVGYDEAGKPAVVEGNACDDGCVFETEGLIYAGSDRPPSLWLRAPKRRSVKKSNRDRKPFGRDWKQLATLHPEFFSRRIVSVSQMG